MKQLFNLAQEEDLFIYAETNTSSSNAYIAQTQIITPVTPYGDSGGRSRSGSRGGGGEGLGGGCGRPMSCENPCGRVKSCE